MNIIFNVLLVAALSLLATIAAAAAPDTAASERLFDKARTAHAQGRLADAESAYRQYIKLYGPSPQVLANLGALLAKREHYPEAIRLYQQALKADPSLTPLHLNLGLAYFKNGQFAPALREFDALLVRTPDNAQARQLKAMTLLELEQFAEAEQQFRTLPAGDPSVTLGLATAILRQGRNTEARTVLDPLLSRTDLPQIQLTLGQALLEEGRLDEALAAFLQAQKIDPQLPLLRLNIGAVYWRQRNTDAALTEWRSEYKTNPDSFEAVYTLGAALALNPDTHREAESLLRKAVALRPGNARAAYQLGKLIWQSTKNKEAAEFLARATKADPNFREAFVLHGTVLQALGQKQAATAAFARARQLSEQELSRQRDLFSESQP